MVPYNKIFGELPSQTDQTTANDYQTDGQASKPNGDYHQHCNVQTVANFSII
jgi:hypothetical protein